MLVVVVVLDVVVIVPDVASVSRLFVAVSWAVAVLVPSGLFHIDAVLSLSLLFFLNIPLACFGSHSFIVVPVPYLLSLSLLPAFVVSLFPELVLQYVCHYRPS